MDGQPVEIISDIFEADYVYEHPELGHRACCDGSKRVACGLYYDGVNCVNQLGAFSGTHTLGMFYLQIYNLPQEQRQRIQNTFLVCIGYEHEIKYYGMEQVISGFIRRGDSIEKEDYYTGTSIGKLLSLCA